MADEEQEAKVLLEGPILYNRDADGEFSFADTDYDDFLRSGHIGVLTVACVFELIPKDGNRRALLLFHGYPNHTLIGSTAHEAINDALGNQAFCEEGGIGSADWDTLPDL